MYIQVNIHLYVAYNYDVVSVYTLLLHHITDIERQ